MSLALKPRRAPLLWLLLPYMAGLIAAQALDAPLPAWLLVGVGALALGLGLRAARSPGRTWIFATILGLAALGVVRYQTATVYHEPLPDLPEREAELELRLTRLFDARDADSALALATVVAAPTHLERYERRSLFVALTLREGARAPVVSETFRARGLLAPLPPAEARNGFEDYLANQRVELTLRRGDLLELTVAAPQWRYWQESARQRLVSILSRNKRPDSDWTGAYVAMLTGRKSELTSEQKDLFMRSGTMHLFAISGLHIGVIAASIHAILLLARVPRFALPVVALLILLAFVLTTGGSASSWRAFMMVAALYLCHATQRQVSPLSGLALAAGAYLLILPRELFQAGFQMSYLTVACILLFGLPLGRALSERLDPFARIPHSVRGRILRWTDKGRNWLINSFAVSLAATLCASLLGALYFQTVPVYGVFINLIAIPIASLALVAGCGSLIAGLVALAPLSYLFNNAALLLLGAVELLLRGAGALPWAAVSAETVSPAAVWLALAASFVWIAWSYARAQPALRWQLPPLALCLAALLWR